MSNQTILTLISLFSLVAWLLLFKLPPASPFHFPSQTWCPYNKILIYTLAHHFPTFSSYFCPNSFFHRKENAYLTYLATHKPYFFDLRMGQILYPEKYFNDTHDYIYAFILINPFIIFSLIKYVLCVHTHIQLLITMLLRIDNCFRKEYKMLQDFNHTFLEHSPI